VGTIKKKQTLAATIAMLLTVASVAHGQLAAFPHQSPSKIASSLSAQETRWAPRQSVLMNPALRYFGGKNARTVYQQPASRQQPPAPQPVQAARVSKPFNGTVRTSTITPYLNLDVRQSDVGLPNYYAFVKPQLEQQRTNRTQTQRMHRMQQQLRIASTPGIVAPGGGIPTTGHSTQFLNMGSYFPGR